MQTYVRREKRGSRIWEYRAPHFVRAFPDVAHLLVHMEEGDSVMAGGYDDCSVLIGGQKVGSIWHPEGERVYTAGWKRLPDGPEPFSWSDTPGNYRYDGLRTERSAYVAIAFALRGYDLTNPAVSAVIERASRGLSREYDNCFGPCDGRWLYTKSVYLRWERDVENDRLVAMGFELAGEGWEDDVADVLYHLDRPVGMMQAAEDGLRRIEVLEHDRHTGFASWMLYDVYGSFDGFVAFCPSEAGLALLRSLGTVEGPDEDGFAVFTWELPLS